MHLLESLSECRVSNTNRTISSPVAYEANKQAAATVNSKNFFLEQKKAHVKIVRNFLP